MRNTIALFVSILLLGCVLAPAPGPVPTVVPYPSTTATATMEPTVAPTHTLTPTTVVVPPTPTPVGPSYASFAVVGDMQYAVGACRSGFPLQMPVTISELGYVETLLTVGDNMDHGWAGVGYATWDGCYAPVIQSGIDIRPTSGNHDQAMFDKVPSANYYPEWQAGHLRGENNLVTGCPTDGATPSGFGFGLMYAFTRGPVTVLVFEQGNEYWANTPSTWIECQLAKAEADPAIQHVIITMHGPPYSSLWGGGGKETIRASYEHLFTRKVHAVFAGHVHAYEHSVHNGVHYVTTGGAGGPLNTCRATVDEYTTRACEYHFVVVEAVGDMLFVNAVGADDKLIDFFQVGGFFGE